MTFLAGVWRWVWCSALGAAGGCLIRRGQDRHAEQRPPARMVIYRGEPYEVRSLKRRQQGPGDLTARPRLTARDPMR